MKAGSEQLGGWRQSKIEERKVNLGMVFSTWISALKRPDVAL